MLRDGPGGLPGRSRGKLVGPQDQSATAAPFAAISWGAKRQQRDGALSSPLATASVGLPTVSLSPRREGADAARAAGASLQTARVRRG